jgi:hypothetical protein
MANKYGNIIKLDETPAAITPAAGVQNIYGKADNLLYVKNSTGTEYLLNNLPTTLNVLSAVFPTVAQVNTTRVAVPGWSVLVTAGKSYRIQVLANYSTAAATTGGSMGLLLSTASGNIVGYIDATIVNTGAATALRQAIYAVNTTNGTAGSFLTSTGMTLGGIGNFTMDVIFTCTVGGTLSVLWGTEVANSLAQLRIGSTFYAQTLN